MNLRNFVSITTFLAIFLLPMLALAAPNETSGSERAVYGLAACLGMGIAALGCALGQGRAISSALEGICRNPSSAGKVLVPMLLGLAFVESLLIFTWLVALGVSGNIKPLLG